MHRRFFCDRRYRNWEDATGEWVDVTITTVFGQSMEASLHSFDQPEHNQVQGDRDGKLSEPFRCFDGL